MCWLRVEEGALGEGPSFPIVHPHPPHAEPNPWTLPPRAPPSLCRAKPLDPDPRAPPLPMLSQTTGP